MVHLPLWAITRTVGERIAAKFRKPPMRVRLARIGDEPNPRPEVGREVRVTAYFEIESDTQGALRLLNTDLLVWEPWWRRMRVRLPVVEFMCPIGSPPHRHGPFHNVFIPALSTVECMAVYQVPLPPGFPNSARRYRARLEFAVKGFRPFTLPVAINWYTGITGQ